MNVFAPFEDHILRGKDHHPPNLPELEEAMEGKHPFNRFPQALLIKNAKTMYVRVAGGGNRHNLVRVEAVEARHPVKGQPRRMRALKIFQRLAGAPEALKGILESMDRCAHLRIEGNRPVAEGFTDCVERVLG
jgi:hypothetical protein